jgi:hypothetical protein
MPSNVEPISDYDDVGIELQAESADLTVSGGGHGGEPLASADAANAEGNRWLAPMRLTESEEHGRGTAG